MSILTRIALALALLTGPVARADVTYDATQHAICVTGFSQDTPGALKDVVAANDQAGWGC